MVLVTSVKLNPVYRRIGGERAIFGKAGEDFLQKEQRKTLIGSRKT